MSIQDSVYQRISSRLVQTALHPQVEGTTSHQGFTIEFLETIVSTVYALRCEGQEFGHVRFVGGFWKFSADESRTFKTSEAAAAAAFDFWMK